MKYLCFFLLVSASLTAQIRTQTQLLHTQYYEADKLLSTAQLWHRLENNSYSVVLAKQSRKELRTAAWLQAAGVLILGIQTAHWASSGHPPKWQWSLPAVAAVGFSISLQKKGRSHQQQAMDQYNQRRQDE